VPSKRELLCEFYTTIDTQRIKVEIKNHDFDFIRKLKSTATLDYCEIEKDICKYRLSGLSYNSFINFLDSHLKKELNLCAYFNREKNSLFAFNLDSTALKANDIKIYALFLLQCLIKLGIPPLVIKSGHGYHFWCRLDEPVENSKLRKLMNAVSDHALYLAKQNGVDAETLRCTRYPRQNTGDISIRLFGSKHMITGIFSSIVTRIDIEDTILDENESWNYFEGYLSDCHMPLETFNKAYERAEKRDF
jgi:hypothetical protein